GADGLAEFRRRDDRGYAKNDPGAMAASQKFFIEAGAQPAYAPARARLRVDASPHGRERGQGQGRTGAGTAFVSIAGLQRVAASTTTARERRVLPVRTASRMRTLYLDANGVGWRSVVIDTLLRGIFGYRDGDLPPKPLRRFRPAAALFRQLRDVNDALSYAIDWRDAIVGSPELDVEWCNINNLLHFATCLRRLKEYGLIVVSHAAAVTIWVCCCVPQHCSTAGVRRLSSLSATNTTCFPIRSALSAKRARSLFARNCRSRPDAISMAKRPERRLSRCRMRSTRQIFISRRKSRATSISASLGISIGRSSAIANAPISSNGS